MSDTAVPLDQAFAEACRLLGEAQVRESFYKRALADLAQPEPPADDDT